MNEAFLGTIAIFLAGVIYSAGRLTARIESLESSRRDLIQTLNQLHDGIRRLELIVRNGKKE